MSPMVGSRNGTLVTRATHQDQVSNWWTQACLEIGCCGLSLLSLVTKDRLGVCSLFLCCFGQGSLVSCLTESLTLTSVQVDPTCDPDPGSSDVNYSVCICWYWKSPYIKAYCILGFVELIDVVFSTEFVPHIEKLFDESVLIGSGWTTYESLRYDIVCVHSSVPHLIGTHYQ